MSENPYESPLTTRPSDPVPNEPLESTHPKWDRFTYVSIRLVGASFLTALIGLWFFRKSILRSPDLGALIQVVLFFGLGLFALVVVASIPIAIYYIFFKRRDRSDSQ